MAKLIKMPPHGFEDVIERIAPTSDSYARQEVDQLRHNIKVIEDKLLEVCQPTEEVREWVFEVRKKEGGMTITAKAK
jgi:hypothetical protein